MRIQHERGPAFQLSWPALDFADAGVAVLHRRRKLPGLKRRTHPLIFARGHTAPKHDGLRAPADPAVSRPDHDIIRGGIPERLRPDLATAGLGNPEGAGGLGRHAV